MVFVCVKYYLQLLTSSSCGLWLYKITDLNERNSDSLRTRFPQVNKVSITGALAILNNA